MSEKKIIIYFYNRLFDPVIQSNFWLYIQELLGDPQNPYFFHVVTYEDNEAPLTPAQQDLVRRWKAQGVGWTALEWHRGASLSKKLQDLLAGFLAVLKLRMQGYRYITSLNSVAGAFAYLYSLVLGLRLYMYQYEPHSEYAIDNGIWAKESRQFKITNFLERKSAHFASVISSGTRFMEQRLTKDWKVSGKFFKIPSVANSDKFKFDPLVREEMRKSLGIEDRWVLLYPGKFGDLYYKEEFAHMFRWLLDLEPKLFLLIVTPHTDEEVHNLLAVANIPREAYCVCHSGYDEIQRYYFAADFGIISVPPGPSKKFISNIKVGEYLCAGLPYLVTRGVSEDYIYAEEQNVGVVVDDFVEDEVVGVWPKMKELLTQDPEARRAHCRQVGLEYRGFENLYPRVKAAFAALVDEAPNSFRGVSK